MSYISPIKIGKIQQMEEGWADKISKYIAGEVDNLVLESCVKVGCHVDKDELEKALRYDRDQYSKGYADGKRDAADAIEALEKQIDSIENEKTNLEADIINLEIALDKANTQLPKRGEWLYGDKMPNYPRIPYKPWIQYCSECGEPTKQDANALFDYCPNCGAKMREVQE